jgi:hypothetical protein
MEIPDMKLTSYPDIEYKKVDRIRLRDIKGKKDKIKTERNKKGEKLKTYKYLDQLYSDEYIRKYF